MVPDLFAMLEDQCVIKSAANAADLITWLIFMRLEQSSPLHSLTGSDVFKSPAWATKNVREVFSIFDKDSYSAI